MSWKGGEREDKSNMQKRKTLTFNFQVLALWLSKP